MIRRRRWVPRSLRSRLTLLFALGTLLAVAGTSVGIYVVLEQRADQAIDDGLDGRATTIASTIGQTQPEIGDEEPFAVVLSATGTIVASSPTIVDPKSVLHSDEFARALTGTMIVNRAVPGLSSDARLLAKAEDVNGQTFVVVTGVDLRAVHASTARLVAILAVAAVVLATLIAGGSWLLIGAALRPVHRLTAEAEEISRIDDAARRLPDPGTTDEIGELARTLNAMLERLAVSFKRERAFVDDASHELRSPLAVLQTELELALSGPADPVAQRAALESALEETRRLVQLAQDLLVLSRASAGELPARRVPVDVAAAVRVPVARLAGSRPDVAVQITGAATTATDPDRLEQIVTNLVTNALRYARSQVRVDVSTTDGDVDLVVSDDGPGFSEDFLPRAFDRFSQSDPSRTRSAAAGSGLGLAIVAALCATLGATVVASNEGPLGGSAVRVKLPAR
jgi:two-component system OmpR family sensor kinase